MMRLSSLALLLFASAASAGTAVVLPFDNIAGSEQAPMVLRPLIEKAVSDRGWKIVAADAIEPLLEARRVRYLDALDEPARAEMASKLGADAFLFTTILVWREGENPVVAASARAVAANGILLWSDAAAVSSTDTEHLLQLGRQTAIGDVARTTVEKLMHKFPPAGRNPRPVRGESGGLFRRGPRTYRSAMLPRGARTRICILPVDAKRAPGDAGRIVDDLLTIRLSASDDFEVVDAATFRAAARENAIRSFRNISSSELAAMGETLGTTLFLRGTIFTYRDVPPRAARAVPEFELDLSLIDARSGHVLWAANHYRRGNDYEGLLLLGGVTNIVTLADRVISEMIAAEERAKPRPQAPGGQKSERKAEK